MFRGRHLPDFSYDSVAMQRAIDEDFFARQMLPIVATTASAERFVIKTLSRFEAGIEDSELRREIKRLKVEESRHIRAHEALTRFAAQYLVEDGAPLQWASRQFLTRFERAPDRLRLSIAAAYEYTADAYLGAFVDRYESARARGGYARVQGLERSGIARLMLWHAAEEHGHRDVAHDVADAMHIGYVLRIIGFLCVAFDLLTVATPALLRYTPLRHWWRIPWRSLENGYAWSVFIYMAHYFRPRFHPSKVAFAVPQSS